ncbi:myoneurin-like [Sitodiplosis mosellana]|uniref:myoneurin-like n=1 Tax=Sitodiplosis mosellana TaxID=263140 RepID=UPI0024446840|nr:myoneurin-like [Sitodiplosis mosellana]
MNPFKSVSGRQRQRKSKSAKVEVKQEPGIKEEPNDGDDVMNIPRPRVEGRYRANYEGPFDFGSNLQTHSMTHIDGPPNACAKCDRRFATPDDKQAHETRCQRSPFASHSDQFPIQCLKCFGGYATEGAKEVHENGCGYHHYQCHLCKKYRRDKQDLKIHMRKDHTGERIQCEKMKPFKGVPGRCSKRKSKSTKVEVKHEPGIKEEPTNDDEVMNIPRPRVDGRYRANYEGPINFGYDFDEVKDGIKCEEEETGKEGDSTPCERSNEGAAANADDNEKPTDDTIDVQLPQPVGSIKDEIKCEEEETGKEKDSTPCERLNESGANDDDNEQAMGDAVDVEPPQPVESSGQKAKQAQMPCVQSFVK